MWHDSVSSACAGLAGRLPCELGPCKGAGLGRAERALPHRQQSEVALCCGALLQERVKEAGPGGATLPCAARMDLGPGCLARTDFLGSV